MRWTRLGSPLSLAEGMAVLGEGPLHTIAGMLWQGMGTDAQSHLVRLVQNQQPIIPRGCQWGACPAYSLCQPCCSVAVMSQGSMRCSWFGGRDEGKT